MKGNKFKYIRERKIKEIMEKNNERERAKKGRGIGKRMGKGRRSGKEKIEGGSMRKERKGEVKMRRRE